MSSRILHLCSNRNVLYTNLWEKVLKNNIDLQVFHFSNKKLGMPASGSCYDKAYIDTALPFNSFDRCFFLTKERKILRAFKSRYAGKSFNLIHAHTLFSEGYIAYKLHQETGIPYMVAVRNTDLNFFFKYRKYLHGLGCKILRSAEKIIFLTPAYEKKLYDKYIPERYCEDLNKKDIVIPNGIDDIFLQNMAEPKSRETGDRLNIITVGVVDRNKNQLYVCKQLEKFKQRNPEIKLSYKNFGKIKDKKYASLIEMHDFVELCPAKPHEELIDKYRKADVFVMLSKTESFGIVYGEAISQALPILYTKGEGFDNQFEDGFVGYAVDLSKKDDFVQRLECILNDYEGFSGRAIRGAHKFDWDKIARQYSDIYAEIIHANGKSYEIKA